jgi:hypothetical protein
MEVCGRAAAVLVHREYRETQHIVSGAQDYARRARAVKKLKETKRCDYFIQFQLLKRLC